MTKLKGLLLTEGMHGMISQVEGLAKALNLEFIHEKIELNNFWKMIPPKLTPVKDFVFKNDISKKFNIVISCGRKSVVPSIFLKNKFKNKIMNIHIQDPKVSLNNFDYVVAPEHDGLEGINVLKSKGAIHYLTEAELVENTNYLRIKPINTFGAPARGATVTLHTNLRNHAKTIDAGSGYLCQMEPVAHYGLREGEIIKNITIKWTNGTIDSYEINDINNTFEFKQGI